MAYRANRDQQQDLVNRYIGLLNQAILEERTEDADRYRAALEQFDLPSPETIDERKPITTGRPATLAPRRKTVSGWDALESLITIAWMILKIALVVGLGWIVL